VKQKYAVTYQKDTDLQEVNRHLKKKVQNYSSIVTLKLTLLKHNLLRSYYLTNFFKKLHLATINHQRKYLQLIHHIVFHVVGQYYVTNNGIQ
jgi:hypothetical protein